MSDDKKSNDDDLDMFRAMVGDVTPVKHDKVTHAPKRPAPIKRHSPSDHGASDLLSLSDDYLPDEVGVEDDLFFARSGVQKSLLRQLRRGQVPFGAKLDLHGMVVTEARGALVDFMAECQMQGIPYVIIIHGKGYRSQGRQPVLKGMTNRWLRQHPACLAFCSAQARDGGRGAVYAVIKKQPAP